MATIQDILRKKGDQVYSIGRSATVLEAAVMMNEHKIGALVVINGSTAEGIITERDVLRRVVAMRKDPGEVLVEDAMTTDMVYAEPETAIEEARSTMKNRRIRHLPVIDSEGNLRGMVSIGDLNAHHQDVQETTIHSLKEYLYGRT